jgi:hypothetical protein
VNLIGIEIIVITFWASDLVLSIVLFSLIVSQYEQNFEEDFAQNPSLSIKELKTRLT